jgi:starch synthase
MVFADSISTVSPRYAQEIQSSPLGCGLEGVLQYRRNVLTGILNGIDPHEWDPAVDPHLPANYGVANVDQVKPICKAAVRKELGLPRESTAPLVGFVGRLTDQKGLDLIVDVMQRWLPTSDVQWAILGTGQPKYHKMLQALAERFPQKLALRLEFSNPLAHRIEAGADIFLMPSQYEPSGLNQMFSLRYGTVPVVRATGGLDDTIDAETGFKFEDYTGEALLEALRAALAAYGDPETWTAMMLAGMRRDFSWQASAAEYSALYRRLTA